MQILDIFLDIIYPPTCEICGKLGSYLCDNCYKSLDKYKIQTKNKIIAPYKYDGKIRELFLQYKFYDKSYLCNLFAEIIIKNEKICKIINNCDIIISVPLHKRRELERGYNQSKLIIDKVAKKLEKTVQKNVLTKVKNIKPQSEKGYRERKNDIKGVFVVKNKHKILKKKVLLFDDIYTTGSTTKECKKVLLNAGAKSVTILTLAKD